MPTITVDDSINIGQSLAISYYIASELGMMVCECNFLCFSSLSNSHRNILRKRHQGSTNAEAAEILSIREHLKELEASKGWAYFDKPTEEQLVAFFDGGSTDTSGQADMKTRSSRALPFYLGRLERLVGTEGFAVGSQFSLADALIYNTFGETLKDNEANESVPKYRREPGGDGARMAKALAAHPNVLRIVENYRASISGYLSSRGEQRF